MCYDQEQQPEAKGLHLFDQVRDYLLFIYTRISLVQSMMQTFLGLASAVPLLAGATPPGRSYARSYECCRRLQEAGIQSVFTQNDPTYLEHVQSYWSVTSQLTPSCFVQPEDTQEVSTVISTLVEKTDCKFAVRSGGHSSNAGFNNIEDGVTIDLGLLNGISYDSATKIASLGPGSRWLDV